MEFIFLFLCESDNEPKDNLSFTYGEEMKVTQNIIDIIMHIAKTDKVLRKPGGSLGLSSPKTGRSVGISHRSRENRAFCKMSLSTFYPITTRFNKKYVIL